MARRFCLALAALAALWALAVALTGGFLLRLGPVRFSSRSSDNALLIALAGGAAAWLLAPRGLRLSTIAADLAAGAARVRELAVRPPGWLAAVTAAAIAVSIALVGIVKGALVAGGADAYGYVSQAEGWAAGTIRYDEPLIRAFDGRVPRDALVPYGFAAVGTQGVVVPRYAPGMPMVMGVFQRVAGREAVFYVVPVLGAMAVFATYLMGARLAGRAVGLAAAVLLATSPSFLFQLTAAPMSDVPVTAWWALCLAFARFDSGGGAFLSGLAASAAILTRPNLAPLALIPMMVFVWDVVRQRTFSRPMVQRGLWFIAGVVPGCVTVAALHAVWYGSPFMSGYGSLSGLYEWRNFWPNLARYPAWVVESQTPIVLAAFLAPWVIGRLDRGPETVDRRVVAWSWLAFILVVLASYLFYEPFDAWWFVRFMLPAYPPLLVLTGVTLVAAVSRLPFTSRVLVPIALVGIVAWYGVGYARDHNVFSAQGERKYAIVAEYVVRRLPEHAALISMQHSGSLRYYARRATVRFDLLPEMGLDATLDALRQSGYRPYFLLEPFEVEDFRRRHAGHSAFGALDWPPIALLRLGNIRIYDPADRMASRAGRPPLTEVVP